MARYKYDATRILEGAANQSPFLLQLPAGGWQLVASMMNQATWRSTFELDGQPLTDEQWDIIDLITTQVYKGIEDGENVDELSLAIRYLTDNLTVTNEGQNDAAQGCCFDLVSDIDDVVSGSGNGITSEIIEAIRGVVVGEFTDSGSNFPEVYADRNEFLLAKCAAANQLYRDFRTTLGGLQFLDLALLLTSTYLLGSFLFGTGGAFVGFMAGAAVLPATAITIVAFMLSFMLLFNQIGLRLIAVADRLDRETFVCAAYEATTYEEMKAALLAMVQDAHDLAVAESAFTFNELFEGKLLELVAIMVPNEILESVLQGAAILIDIIVELPEDVDCATCGPAVPTEQFSITDFTPYSGQNLPLLGWYMSHGVNNVTVETGTDYLKASNCCSNRAAHEVTFGSAGLVDVFYDRYGNSTSVNVSFYIDSWDGAAWINEHTTGQKVGTGTTSEELLAFPVTADLYRFSWRIHNSGGSARFSNPSLVYTPD